MLAPVLGSPGEAKQLLARDAVGKRDVGNAHRALGHGPGLVQHDRRDPPRLLESLRPLDQDPELCAAAGPDHQRRRCREPERARAGDDHDGDRGGEGRGCVSREREPARERRQRERDHDRDEDGRDAVGEPLDRRLARLRLGDETPDLGERRLGADLAHAYDQAPVRVDRRAGDLGARPDLDRHRFAGQQRLVDCRSAILDDAVRRHLLARTDDEAVADPELFDRHDDLDSVPEHAGLLRTQLEQGADRCARAPPGPRLEVAAEQDQGRDHRPHLEVGVGIGKREQSDERPPPGGEGADRDQRVHRRSPVPQVERRGAMEAPAAPEHDGRRERERKPLPAVELERRDHRDRCQRRSQYCGDDQP